MKNLTTTPFKKLLPKDLIRMPWKNGGGMTTEIARGGKSTDERDWGWRISIAGVLTDGPFSIFKGVDRTITVIEGNGMDLDFLGTPKIELNLFEVVKFDGGQAFEGRLKDGPIKDFNVMVDRNLFDANLVIHDGQTQGDSLVANHSLVLVHLLKGKGAQIGCKQNIFNLRRDETIIYRNNDVLKICSSENALIAIVKINENKDT